MLDLACPGGQSHDKKIVSLISKDSVALATFRRMNDDDIAVTCGILAITYMYIHTIKKIS